jgi:hypothetical protein
MGVVVADERGARAAAAPVDDQEPVQAFSAVRWIKRSAIALPGACTGVLMISIPSLVKTAPKSR